MGSAHSSDGSNRADVLREVRENSNWHDVKEAVEEFGNDREIVLAAVKKNGEALQFASENLKNDREIVLTAVKENGWALEYASDELKSDRDFVLAAVKTHGDALYHASDDLKSDRDFVLEAVKQKGWTLKYASKNLKSNREVVLAAVKRNGDALQFASKDLKNNRETVLAAVKRNAWALQYASDDLKSDREIVLAGVKRNGEALQFASDDLKNNREFVLAAAAESNELVGVLREVVLAAATNNVFTLDEASENLKNNREIVLAAVKRNGEALQFASENLKNDHEFVLAAVESNSEALKYASDELKNNREFVLAAAAEPNELVGVLREIVLAAATNNVFKLDEASENLKNDSDIVLAAAMTNDEALQNASTQIVRCLSAEDDEKGKFCLLQASSLFEFRCEAIHFFAEHNHADSIEVTLQKYGTDLAHSTAKFDQENNDRPLHRASRKGHLASVQVLFDLGGPVKNNKQGMTPLAVAKECQGKLDRQCDGKFHQYDEVIEFLGKSQDLIATGIGAGDGKDDAENDDRPIVRVVWHTCPLPGFVGWTGACHSVLEIEVEAQSRFHHCRYFIENVEDQENVKISRWTDAAHRQHRFKPHKTANTVDITGGLRMTDLFSQLGNTLPYHVAENNCHDFAKHIFNFCLKEGSPLTVKGNLNKIHASVANFVGHQGSMICQATGCGGVKVACNIPASTSAEIEPVFRIDSSSHKHVDLETGLITARLSDWVYTPIHDLPDPSFCQEVLVEISSESPVQWAAVTSHDTFYIVFKGTDKLHELLLLDLNGTPQEWEGIGVQGGMWLALHKHGVETTQQISKHVSNSSNGRRIVLCGHSLGGGLAILCGLELIQSGLNVSAVMAHGAPQVIVPSYDKKPWKDLSRVTTVFINSFDIVPRLPSCHEEWRDALLECVPAAIRKKTLGSFEAHCDGVLENMEFWNLFESMDNLRHVGQLVFMASNPEKGSSGYMVMDARAGWDKLMQAPLPSGWFVVRHHSEYAKVLESLSKHATNAHKK